MGHADVGGRRIRFLCAQHLEGKLRHAVAKGPQPEVFHHYIGRATIGRHRVRPLDRGNRRVGQLITRPAIDRHIQRVGRDFFPIRPDPADAGDLPFTQGDGEADAIAVFRRMRGRGRALATAAARHCRGLGEIRGPDHLSPDTHPAIDLRNRRALARLGQTKAVDLAGLDRLRPLPQQPLVDHTAKGRPHGTPNGDRRQARHCAPDRAANRRTCG